MKSEQLIEKFKELDEKIKIMSICHKMNNHQFEKEECIKCGFTNSNHISLNWYLTILTLIFNNQGVARRVESYSYASELSPITYEEDVLMKQYIEYLLRKKKISQQIKDKIQYLYDGFIDVKPGKMIHRLVIPFKHNVEYYSGALNHRYLSKEWILEFRDANLNAERFPETKIHWENVDLNSYYRDLIEYKLLQSKTEEALAYSLLFWTYDSKIKFRINIKESLIPFLPIQILSARTDLIKRKAEDILKIYLDPQYSSIGYRERSTIYEIVQTAYSSIDQLKREKYVYKPTDSWIEVRIEGGDDE